MLLVSATLSLGGAAIGSVIGAIDGGVDALTKSADEDKINDYQAQAMQKSLSLLSLQSDLLEGLRKQVYESGSKRFDIIDASTVKSPGKVTAAERSLFVHLSEIKAVKVDREGWIKLLVTVSGSLSYKQKTLKDGFVSAQFISEPVHFNTWFAEDAKLFKDTLKLASRLSAAKLLSKLQGRLAS